MDRKCKNCNQFISDGDRFCKYCGCPSEVKEAVEEKPSKQSLKAIEDEIQLKKTLITDNDFHGVGEYAFGDLTFKKIGSKESLRAKNYLISAFALLLAIASIVGDFLLFASKDMNIILRFSVLIIINLVLMASVIILIERVNSASALSLLKADNIVIRKTGFKKQAETILGGIVFEVTPQKSCPVCDGEIKGELHIEKIENRLIAICNYNRKHFWEIDIEKSLKIFKGEAVDNSKVEQSEKEQPVVEQSEAEQSELKIIDGVISENDETKQAESPREYTVVGEMIAKPLAKGDKETDDKA